MALNNLFLLVSMVIVCLAPGIHGTAHLSFADSSEQQVSITRAGCGVTRVCVDQVMNCTSSMEGSCLFASLEVTSRTPPNGSVLNITMQGTAMANEYIAIALRPNTGTTLVFICGRMNETVFRFFTGNLTGSMLQPSETITKQILGNITGDLIQCQFTVPRVNATQARSADITFAVQLARGALPLVPTGTFSPSRTTEPLNLANPPSTVSTTAAPTTPAATTSSGPPSFTPSASLLLLSVLAMLRM
ncbi:unnamed protein product [Gadus morhua 'NCC']